MWQPGKHVPGILCIVGCGESLEVYIPISDLLGIVYGL